MKILRRSIERGHANHGWLNSHHTFSFADYYDPAHMGVGSLRVINDDRVAPGRGFGTHPHREMEIISYVVEGALEHKDSMGTGSVIKAGDVQIMSAGTGVAHSEFNHSQEESLHFLQIWVVPNQQALTPSYQQKFFAEERVNALRLVASSDGAEGSLIVNQDVRLYASVLQGGQQLEHRIERQRQVYLQVVSGVLKVSGETLLEGDGLHLVDERDIVLLAEAEAHFLLFDLVA